MEIKYFYFILYISCTVGSNKRASGCQYLDNSMTGQRCGSDYGLQSTLVHSKTLEKLKVPLHLFLQHANRSTISQLLEASRGPVQILHKCDEKKSDTDFSVK